MQGPPTAIQYVHEHYGIVSIDCLDQLDNDGQERHSQPAKLKIHWEPSRVAFRDLSSHAARSMEKRLMTESGGGPHTKELLDLLEQGRLFSYRRASFRTYNWSFHKLTDVREDRGEVSFLVHWDATEETLGSLVTVKAWEEAEGVIRKRLGDEVWAEQQVIFSSHIHTLR